MRTSFPSCGKFILSLLGSYRGLVFVYSPLLVAQTLVGVAAPFATGRFIDALAYGRPFRAPFAVLVALVVVKTLSSPLLERFVCARARRIETDLQFRILDATMELSPGQLAAVPGGETVAKMTRDAFAVGGFVRGLYPRLLQAATMMFAAGFALSSRSMVLGLAFTVFIPLVILLFLPFARRFSDNSHRVRTQSDTSFNAIFDFLQSLPFLRLLDAERRFADAPHDALTELKRGNDATDALAIRFGFLLNALLVGGEIAVLGIAGSLAAKGTLPVGDVVLYQMLFVSAIQSVQGVITLLPEFSAIREAAGSLGEVLGRTPPARTCAAPETLETLAFDRVTFAYPQTPDRPVVSNFSATLRAGTVVGLSGANGAGKSTLLKLAVGALEPQTGEILLNGRLLGDIDASRFRRRLGIVFQDNLLVTGTIRDNLTLRDPTCTLADVDRALALSGFDAVVKRLPDGLDTRVGSFVRTLSGGERQRLAIARALVRDPMIIVLDEATNHLDSEARKTVAELLARLRPGRLVLLAGHDDEMDRLCDVKISCQIPEDGSYITV